MWVLLTTRGQQLTLAHLPAVLGNGSDADVRVPHESVSPQHARISEGSAGTLRVEALSDGVVGVGGRRVERSLLRDGDELVLGRVKFTLRALHGHGGGVPGPTTTAAPAARLAPVGPKAQAVPAEPELKQRRRTLQFSKVEAKRGLLNADFSQLPAGQRLLLILGVLVLAGALVAGVALLVDLLG